MGYPYIGGKIFISAEYKKNESTIASNFFHSKYIEYEIAYKKAADLLIEKAINEDSLFLCVSIYPIMFLYRQFLELYIKDILFRFDSNFNGNKPPYSKHNIYKLWKKLLGIVEERLELFLPEFEKDQFIEILVACDDYMAEITIFDRNSMAFRYPDDKKHTKSFFPNEIPVDLINLKERMNELANILCLIDNKFINMKVL